MLPWVASLVQIQIQIQVQIQILLIMSNIIICNKNSPPHPRLPATADVLKGNFWQMQLMFW